MDCTRLARREKALSRAIADDTLGEVVVRRLSRKSRVVAGGRPYIPCMLPVDRRLVDSLDDLSASGKSRCLLPYVSMVHSVGTWRDDCTTGRIGMSLRSSGSAVSVISKD
jgi:hypothetical protein